MLARTGRHDFLEGARLSIPVVVSSLPFALLFGAIAVDNGLSIAETVLMSATIYGGASQMVGIELFGQRVAPWLIVASIFAVNFRHVLYSATSAAASRIGPQRSASSVSSCSSIRNMPKPSAGRSAASPSHLSGISGLRRRSI